MNKKTQVTIITAVKNGINCISDTILSVAHYPYSEISFVVVDGKSDDGTVELIQKYDDCIDRWISEPDDGLYDAYNKGWALADKDSYILFLGAGDRLLQLPTEELNPDGDRIICGRVDTGRKRKFVSRVSKMSFFANTLHHQALLIPKRLHIDPPFNTKYRIYADFDFNQRLIKKKSTFINSEKFKTFAMPGGVSQNYSKESYMIAYKNFGLAYGFLAYLFYLYQKSKAYGERVARYAAFV